MSNEVVKKNPVKSKTLWANLIVAAVAFFPGLKDTLTPEQVAMALAVLNMVLRLVTKDKLGLEE